MTCRPGMISGVNVNEMEFVNSLESVTLFHALTTFETEGKFSSVVFVSPPLGCAEVYS